MERWFKDMKKIVLIVWIMFGILKGEEMLNISFYKNNGIMWLIDRGNIKTYSLKSMDEMKSNGEEIEDSFEFYIKMANNNQIYKYDNWRLPTKKELLTLVLSDSWIYKIFKGYKKQIYTTDRF